MDLSNEEWYQVLIEELRAIITETGFTNRWNTIEQKWNIGDYLLNAGDQKGVTELLQHVALELNRSRRDLWYCLQFRKQYSELDKLPEGKSITWHKIVNNYLPAAPENKIELPEGIFSVFYADPPWPYPEHQDPKNLYGSANYHYSRLSIKEICDIGIKRKILDIKATNSVLFLWVATNFLEQSFDVIRAWGFKYKSQVRPLCKL